SGDLAPAGAPKALRRRSRRLRGRRRGLPGGRGRGGPRGAAAPCTPPGPAASPWRRSRPATRGRGGAGGRGCRPLHGGGKPAHARRHPGGRGWWYARLRQRRGPPPAALLHVSGEGEDGNVDGVVAVAGDRLLGLAEGLVDVPGQEQGQGEVGLQPRVGT